MGGPGTGRREGKRKRGGIARLEQRMTAQGLRFNVGRSGERGTTHKKKREGKRAQSCLLIHEASREVHQRGDGNNLYYFERKSRTRGREYEENNKVFLPATGPRGRKGKRGISMA
jgi:hypothetical protein